GFLWRALLKFNAVTRERKKHSKKMFELQMQATRAKLPMEKRIKAEKERIETAKTKRRNYDILLEEIRDLLVLDEPTRLAKREKIRGDPDSRQAQKLKWR
ncbi:unnamed protein product, partial [Amoebophrya sp. A120]